MAEGRTAEIVEHGPDKILKLYRDGFPKEAIAQEYEAHRLAFSLGLPVPALFERIDRGGRAGMVMERVQGDTLLARMLREPEALSSHAAAFAQLHLAIHRRAVHFGAAAPGLHAPRQKAALARGVSHAPYLTESQKHAILEQLERLPAADVLLHGDFHPDNAIVGDRTWAIDWMSATIGHPAGDVARTLLLLRFGAAPDGLPPEAKAGLQRLRSVVSEAYLAEYTAASGLTRQAIDEWTTPAAAARLTDWIPEEEKRILLRLLRERLGAGEDGDEDSDPDEGTKGK
ncbi:phosphotransferase [Paenibacillus sp. TRM 82003]|nr:phosphotransferase [Paenibacillus sp. TRM 82003]